MNKSAAQELVEKRIELLIAENKHAQTLTNFTEFQKGLMAARENELGFLNILIQFITDKYLIAQVGKNENNDL